MSRAQVDERVAHPLRIPTIHTHMMVGMEIAIDGVGVQVEGEHLQCVAMHVKRVGRRIFQRHCTVGSHGIACFFLIDTIVTLKHTLILIVRNDNIAKSLIHTGFLDRYASYRPQSCAYP